MLLHSFRLRITLLFGGLALAMAASLSAAVGSLLGDRLTADNGASLHSLARGVAGVLADGLRDRLKDVELLAGSAFAAHWSDHRAELQTSLTRLQRGGSAYAWVGVVDVAGQVHMATRNMLVGENVSSRPWFTSALEGPFVGDVHPAKLLAALLPPGNDGGPPRFVDFAAPIHGPNGELRGVVGAHGNWDWAGDVVRQLRDERAYERGVRVYILDRHGAVIHRPHDAPKPMAQQPETLRLDRERTGGHLMTWPDGKRYLTASMALPETPGIGPLGWTIVARQPERDALAAATELRWRIAGLGVLAVLVTMACIWVLAGRVSRPLQEMAATAQRIERGDLGAAIPQVRGSSEMQGLSTALRGMTRALLDGQAALQTANNTLEARVLERTDALAAANLELEKLARHDGLTGLLNRRSADERLELEIGRHRRHGHPLSVLLLDIDHFKRINDECGHAVGDEALRRVSACLAAQCRTTDVVARFGGEEFLVLLPETSATAAYRVAEKLRTAIASLEIPGLWPITVSIGLTWVEAVTTASGAVPERGVASPSGHQLLRRADLALYAAKEQGRDRVVAHGEAERLGLAA